MRLAPFILLLAATAANADKLFPGPPRGKQQDFGAINAAVFNDYLPPARVCPSSATTIVTTSVVDSTRRRDFTSTVLQTSGTTVVQTQVVPTTITQRSTVTQRGGIPSTVVQTRTSEVVRSTFRTVTEGGFTSTNRVIVTSTNVVVSTARDTQYSTVNRDVERTQTSVTTVLQPTTITSREVREETRTVPFRPPPEVRVSTRTNVVQSTVVREGRGSTIQTTVLVPTTITSAVRSQPPPVFVTRTATTTKVDFVTQTTTVVSGSVETREVISTRTSVVVQERIVTRDQFTTAFSSRVVPTTIIRSEVSTQVRPTTVVNTRTETRTEERPEVRTSTFFENVIQTASGRDVVVTRPIVTTSVVQRVSTVTNTRAVTITATKTLTAECSKTGYNYNEPSVPFGFPN